MNSMIALVSSRSHRNFFRVSFTFLSVQRFDEGKNSNDFSFIARMLII